MMFEELLDTLELFNFITKMAGEELSYVELYHDTLAKVLRNRVERTINSLPPHLQPKTEQDFLRRPEYYQILEETKSQFRGIIESIKANKLWYSQGSGQIVRETAETLKKLSEQNEFTIQDVQILRSIQVDRICFLPELSLYHISLFKCCLSSENFIRAFCYSQLIDAPTLMDAKQFLEVMNSVISLWSKNDQKSTIEFAGAFYHLLVSLSQIVSDLFDDDLQKSLYKLIEESVVSPNFSLLFLFDPLLKWLPRTLPKENFQIIQNESLRLLKGGSCAHACLIFAAISKGVLPHSELLPTIEASKETIDQWPLIVQTEARKKLSTLGSQLNTAVMEPILAILSDLFRKTSENPLFIFSDFVFSYFFKTNAPFYEPFFLIIEEQLTKRSTQELNRMYISICENPLRLEQALKVSKHPELFSIVLQYPDISCSFLSILYDQNDILLSSFKVDSIISKITSIYELDQDTVDIQINAMIAALLYPQKVLNLVKNFDSLIAEDQKVIICQIVNAIYAGNFSQTPDFIQYLKFYSDRKYETEFTSFIKSSINLKQQNRYKNVETSYKKGPLKVGSKTMINLSLLFEHVVFSEGGETKIAFLRSKIKPAQWFTVLSQSLLTPLFKDTLKLSSRFQETQNDPLSIVWIAFYCASKMANKWLNIIDNEEFSSLAENIFFPLSEELDENEKENSKILADKYTPAFLEIEKSTKL